MGWIRIFLISLLKALWKLNPWTLRQNPILLMVLCGAIYSTWIVISIPQDQGINTQLAGWLWATVLIANFCEAMAEGRGKAQAQFLKQSQENLQACVILENGELNLIPAHQLLVGDIVRVQAGELIPGDGDIVSGIAAIDESSITGESDPVIRESGGDRSSVTAGTRVLSDSIDARITTKPGETAIDKMIALVEGTQRQPTPNERALRYLLFALTGIFVVVVGSLPFYTRYLGSPLDNVLLIALFVTLIPTTIGGLLSAIGIAGMNRLLKINVLAMSGRSVEAAGDVDVMMFDKTGTVTTGARRAVAFYPAPGVEMEELVNACAMSSIFDETGEGKSILELAKVEYAWETPIVENHTYTPFSAATRMSGIEVDGTSFFKGADRKIVEFVQSYAGPLPEDFLSAYLDQSHVISKEGGTPLGVVRHDGKVAHLLGLIFLKDQIKSGLKQKFTQLKRMGIRTVMITGDNEITAQVIAQEAGIDDVIPQATPTDKLSYIHKWQEMGHNVAMCGDGTNDAPALAQADVGIAMNTGTAAAKEAANMIDLDSDPTKIIAVVAVGKQMLMTRGALTTFSVANDVAKYFAIIPALFSPFIPALGRLNVMQLSSPQYAILSAVIFNALILVALLPLALRGVKFKPAPAAKTLRHNVLIYGLGGVIAPFAGIKVIDLLLKALS